MTIYPWPGDTRPGLYGNTGLQPPEPWPGPPTKEPSVTDFAARQAALVDELRLAVACACTVQDAYRLYRLIGPWRAELERLELAALKRADDVLEAV